MTTPSAGLPALLTVTELETWLGSRIDDSGRAFALLDAVSAIIRQIAGQTWEDTEVPAAVKAVALQIAARAWRNPDGYTSERIGEYSYQLPDGVGGLTVIASERQLLEGFRVRPTSGLWSLSTTRSDPAADTEYVPVEGAPPFPWYAT